ELKVRLRRLAWPERNRVRCAEWYQSRHRQRQAVLGDRIQHAGAAARTPLVLAFLCPGYVYGWQEHVISRPSIRSVHGEGSRFERAGWPVCTGALISGKAWHELPAAVAASGVLARRIWKFETGSEGQLWSVCAYSGFAVVQRHQ